MAKNRIKYKLLELYYANREADRIQAVTTKREYERERMAADIVRLTHSLEKGLSIEKIRPLFGKKKIQTIVDLVLAYASKYDASDTCVSMACDALLSWINWHNDNGHTSEEFDGMAAPVRGMIERVGYKVADQCKGGVQTVRLSDMQFDREEICRFFRTRHSIRQFTGEPVDEEVIRAAVNLAQTEMGRRKGDLLSMTPVGNRYRLEFLVPSRGLFGYRSEFLTDTRGEGIMSSVLESYAPMKGEIERRLTGSLISFESGEAVTYGLHAAQERGALFIGPGTPVYAGMVVGICSRNEDMTVNVCKKKQLTNLRASGSDEALRLVTPKIYSLEQCLEFLADDELLECTPKSLRIRKRTLDHSQRMRELMKKRAGQE